MTTIVGVLFLVLALVGAAIMQWRWGSPRDPQTGRITSPRRYILLHRVVGYLYAALYVWMLVDMVPRLWRYAEFTVFGIVHLVLGFLVGAVLIAKVAILRFVPKQRKHIRKIGFALTVLSVLMVAGPVAMVARDSYYLNRAVPLDAVALADLAAQPGVDRAKLEATNTPEGLRAGRLALGTHCMHCHSVGLVLEETHSPGKWMKEVREMTEEAIEHDVVPASEDEQLAIAVLLSAARGRAPRPAAAPAASASESVAAEEAPKGPQVDVAAVSAILDASCASCHGGDKPAKRLRLETIAEAAASRAVVAGNPAESSLVQRVKGIGGDRMPKKAPPLSDEQIALLEAWVQSLEPVEKSAAAPEASQASAAPEAQGPMPGAFDGPPAPPPPPPTPPPAGEVVRFNHIEAILLSQCANCHSGEDAAEGVRLDSWHHTVSADEHLVVVPGSPGASLMLRHIRGQESPRMPIEAAPLSEADEDLIRRWIADGAQDAQGNRAPMPTGAEVRLRGYMGFGWMVDDQEFFVTEATDVDDAPPAGAPVEVRARVRADGQLEAERVRSR